MTNLINKAFEGHNIRIITDQQGDPWFVAADIARALGYNDADQAIRRHCKGVTKAPVETTGGMQRASIIPERDVYRLVMRSKLESAERFEEWVVGEVLPSIRKHGGYLAGQEQDAPELIMAKALMVAQSVIDRKSQELAAAQQTIAANAPAVAFAGLVAGDDKGVLIGNFGRAVGLGQNTLFRILRENRILMSGGNRNNLPFQEYLERGYFTVVEQPYKANGTTHINFTTHVTGKGQQWLTKRLLDLGYLTASAASASLEGI
ncbi:phage antirepressor [Aeromonas caviae]|uniref:phage antirepressor n=1 Tax=Aeromonas caviae TaxID=648 RepID=UPI001CC494A4|nr:phage antirepressor [Aeromonas caviae]GJA84669.1 antirepressor [Aeromonas caviae]GJA88703.1 antirepressor [Aeromonas caviae]GJB06015.1 antirepressor [Aeromonas caviae]GJB14495.1 antirepressor [Aeromonas caviae]GJB35948.1 antirepressor [Aeromonas caviae]